LTIIKESNPIGSSKIIKEILKDLKDRDKVVKDKRKKKLKHLNQSML
jgi:hypothetical protein